MAGIALKRSIRPCFHNGPSGGVIKIKRDLFRKKGSLKKKFVSAQVKNSAQLFV